MAAVTVKAAYENQTIALLRPVSCNNDEAIGNCTMSGCFPEIVVLQIRKRST